VITQWFFVQKSLEGNLKKSFKLYEYCERSLTVSQFSEFLDALEHSRNFHALIILDPNRQLNLVQNLVDTPPLDRTHIHSSDVARILCDKTDLAGHWTVLRDIFQLDARDWDQAFYMRQSRPLLDAFKFILETWSRKGFPQSSRLRKPTVGVLCDLLLSKGHRTSAGK
jgi:hypothetical protein